MPFGYAPDVSFAPLYAGFTSLGFLARGRSSRNVAGSARAAGCQYYFSILPLDVIKQLTINNLKEAFPDNHKFHDLLDQNFNGNYEVSEYDSFHKMYKVNHLLESTYQH